MAKSDATKPDKRHATLRHKLQAENDASVEAVLVLTESDGWEQVTSKAGVTVFRKFVHSAPPPTPSSPTNCGDDGRKTVFQGGLKALSCEPLLGYLF